MVNSIDNWPNTIQIFVANIESDLAETTAAGKRVEKSALVVIRKID